MGHSLLGYIDPADHEKAVSKIKLMLEGTLAGPDEYTAVKADGTRFKIEVNGLVIKDNDGNPFQMIFITSDISGRKDAEALVRKKIEYHHLLVENISDAIFRIDDKGIRISTKSLFSDGKFMGGTGTVVDINEKKSAELSLKRSEERLRNIIDQTQTIIWEVDKDGL